MSSAFAAIASASGLVREATPFPASVCDLISVYAAASGAEELLRAATMADPAPLRNLLQPSARGDVLGAFRPACRRGDQRLALWLAARFGLTAAEARGDNNFALRAACSNGHLATAQWLASHFGLTAADARAQDNFALSRACSKGHLATAQWLAAHFGLAPADARASGNHALRSACEGGHLATAQWLAARFGLEAADARARALHDACEGGHLATAQWLAEHFGLTPADACETRAPMATSPCACLALAATSRPRGGWPATSASQIMPTQARTAASASEPATGLFSGQRPEMNARR